MGHHAGPRGAAAGPCCAALLTPDHWLQVLRDKGLDQPGTVLVSGTVLMTEGVDRFADRWRVELADPRMGRRIELAYDVKVLPEPVA